MVVAFAKNIGPDFNGFAGDALDRRSGRHRRRINVLDPKARAGRVGRGRSGSSEAGNASMTG